MFHGESKLDRLPNDEQAKLQEQAFIALKAFYEAINKTVYQKAQEILERNKQLIIDAYGQNWFASVKKGFDVANLLQIQNQPEPLINDVIIHSAPEIQVGQNLSYTDTLINRRLSNRTRPFSRSEYLIFFSAVGAAVGSSSTSYQFSRNFIHIFNPGELIEKALASISSPPAFLAQFAFTLRTNLNFDLQVARYLGHEFKHFLKNGSFDELKRDFWPFVSSAFGTIFPSAMAAVATGYRSFKSFAPRELLIIQGILRFKGAGVSNATFAQRYSKDKLIEKNKADGKCVSLTLLLGNIRDRLQLLAINYPLAYIQAIDSGFFDVMSKDTTFATKVDALIEMHYLLNEMEIELSKREVPKWIEWTAVTAGAITCLMNIAATRYVPDVFGGPYINDLIEFFREMSHEAPTEWKIGTLALFLVCLIYMGRPSGLSNTLINGQSTRKTLVNGLDLYNKGRKEYFSSYSKAEMRRFKVLCLFSVCFGGMSGGNFYGYPFLNWAPFYIPGALITAVIFTFNSHVWLSTFLNNVDDAKHRKLFQDFNASTQKLAYYNDLNDAEQSKLVGLIDTYFSTIFTGLIDDVNELAPTDLNVYGVLTAMQIDQLEQIRQEIAPTRGDARPSAEARDAAHMIEMERAGQRPRVLSLAPSPERSLTEVRDRESKGQQHSVSIVVAKSDTLPSRNVSQGHRRRHSMFTTTTTMPAATLNQPLLRPQPQPHHHLKHNLLYNSTNATGSPLGSSPTIYGDTIKPLINKQNKKTSLYHPSSRTAPFIAQHQENNGDSANNNNTGRKPS